MTEKSQQATPLSALADLQNAGMGSLSWMGTAWVENMSDMYSEVLSFVAERVKEDVNTQHALLHCKDVAQIQKIQADFIQKALDQYSVETGKLVELNSSFLSAAQNAAKAKA